MKKYYLIGGTITFIIIFNLGYVFHEIIMGNFFKEYIGAIQREAYNIPLIAFSFILYIAYQTYFLPVYFESPRALTPLLDAGLASIKYKIPYWGSSIHLKEV
jgi:hypothetical protein